MPFASRKEVNHWGSEDGLWWADCKVVPWSLPPGIHVFVEPPPFDCGQCCDLLLISRIWQR